MSSFFKAIDLYGTKYHMTIKHNQQYKTSLGGGLTIITLSIFITFFFIFGRDILDHNNPITSTTIFNSDSLSKTNLSSYNITIAFSLDKPSGDDEPLNLTGGFFWSDLTQEDNSISDIDNTIYFAFKRCVDLSYQPTAKFPYKYYCIEFPSSFIMKPGASFVYSIFNCDQKLPHGLPYGSCNSIKKLNETFLKLNTLQYHMTIYYPVFYYDPYTKNNTDSIHYERLSFPFDYNLQRTDTLFIYDNIINEDSGWFFEKTSNTTYYGIGHHDYSLQYKSDNELQIPLSTSQLYQLRLELSSKTFLYYKRYIKIPEILAIITTLIKVFMVIFQVMTNFINHSLINLFFFNELFDSYPITSPLHIHENSIIKHNNNKSMTSFSLDHHINNPNIIPSHHLTNNKSTYSFCFAIKHSISKLLMSPSKKMYIERYDIGQKVIRNDSDLIHYIKMISDILILQRAVFDKPQLHTLDHLNKININDDNELKEYFSILRDDCQKNSKREVFNYLSNIGAHSNEGIMNQRDLLLFKRINEDIKQQIQKASNQ